MGSYVIRRLLLIVPTLILVTMIVFGLVRLVPGSVVDLMAAELGSQSGLTIDEMSAQLKGTLGLDVPIHVQYFRWLSGILRGDLGTTLWSKSSVTEELLRKIPVSFELGLMALIISVIISLPIGVLSAVRQDTIQDYAGRSIAIIALSLPNFWVATMIIVFPSIWWGWVPRLDYVPFTQNPGANLLQFIIPAAIMGMNMSGGTMRMTRTMMLEVLRQDYIRTGWSKGLNEKTVIMRHAIRNAFIPIITQIGMRVPILIAGAVIMEQIFCLPGVGQYLVTAIGQRDYPIVSGINLVLAAFILLVNLTVDLSYAYLDPRVQYK
jgi:peptide/nickel transport system permease protein